MYAARSERRQPRGRYSFFRQGSGALGAWPDSPDMNATPAQLYQEYVDYNVRMGNPNGAWRQLDPAYIGQYLWDQIHPANLINTGQWGNVGAIGATGTSQPGGAGTPVQPATAWVQTATGEIREATTGAVLDRVPGSSTMEDAAAAEAVRREDARARANPIPEGFYLDPRVNQEWLEANAIDVGGAEGAELYEGAGTAIPAGVMKAGLGLLALGLLFGTKRRGRRR